MWRYISRYEKDIDYHDIRYILHITTTKLGASQYSASDVSHITSMT